MVAKKKVIPVVPADCMPMCGTCKFATFDLKDESAFCHYNPPVAVQEGDSYSFSYAVVNRDDWCGRYQRHSN